MTTFAACTPDVDEVDTVDAHDITGVFYGDPLQGCPNGKVEDVPYYFPLRDGAEFFDISYMDSPNGDSPQTYPVGVRYDFHRDASEMGGHNDNIHSTPGARDYMGSDNTYERHNGYDNSIEPRRVVREGGGLVYPMAPGKVTFITDNEWPQMTLGVEHANGFSSVYTHLRWGSAQVRKGDRVDRTTVLGQLDGASNEHLHYWLGDCSAAEPSYYEVFRADRHLMALKPLYDSGPSDASDIVAAVGTADDGSQDRFRWRRGETIQLMGTGQWRTSDQVTVQLVDPNGGLHGVSQATNTSLGRGYLFRQYSSYTIGAADTLGYWTAQVLIDGTVRASKYFQVTAANSTPDANGPMQSAASIVSSGPDNVRAYYRSDKGTLFSWRWRARQGWDYTTHAGTWLGGAPSCVQRDATLVDCFYKTDDKLYRWASTDGGNTGTSTVIYSGAGAGDPGAFSTGPTSLEIAFADNGTVSLLHFDGASFTKKASTEKVAQTPSCVVEDANNWLCFARAATGELREITVVNGGVAGGSTAPTGSQWSDVQALLVPGTLDQKSHVVVIDTAGGAMRHRQQVRYHTAPTVRWIESGGETTGAGELSTSPRCAMRPGMLVPECFAANLDHNIIRTAFTGTRWLPWQPIITSAMDRQAPSLVSLGGDRLDAFYAAVPDTQSTLVQRTQTDQRWSAEQSLASGDLSFAPSCAARGGQLDCFTVSAGGAIVRRIFNGTSWSIQAAQPSGAAGSVSAVALSSTVESAMFLDSAGNLVERGLTATAWSGTSVVVGKPAGTKLVDAPGCTARVDSVLGSTVIDCFARTADGRLAAITKTNSAWSGWSFVPNAAPRSAPSAVSATPGTVDVFFRSADNVLVQMTRGTGGTWSEPAILGGSIASAPSCAARTAPTRIDCIAQGFRGLRQDVVHYSYQATIGWVLPQGLGTALANLALHKRATQSSEFASAPGPATRAVDGTIDGNFNNGSVTHTDKTTQASWWQVDLGAIRSIDHVQVFNRTDAAVERLAGFVVMVSDNGVSWFLGQDPTPRLDRTGPIPFPGTYMPIKRSGRFVRVFLTHPEFLSLAEVMVMGRDH